MFVVPLLLMVADVAVAGTVKAVAAARVAVAIVCLPATGVRADGVTVEGDDAEPPPPVTGSGNVGVTTWHEFTPN